LGPMAVVQLRGALAARGRTLAAAERSRDGGLTPPA
jgi:hypothetical protein